MAEIVPSKGDLQGFPEGYRYIQFTEGRYIAGRYGLERMENGQWVKYEDRHKRPDEPFTNRGTIEECRDAAWSDYRDQLVEQANARIHNPYDKILGWAIGDGLYHPGCVPQEMVMEPRRNITARDDGSAFWNYVCSGCGMALVENDALYHLLFGRPENCECTACMRTSLAAEDSNANHSLGWIWGFRVGAGNFFEECKEEGWVDDIPVEQWFSIYRGGDESVAGYRAAERGEYSEDDLSSWMR
jgi:hypothetical protein